MQFADSVTLAAILYPTSVYK